MSGLRVGHEAAVELGMQLPGLAKRAKAIAELPPLGLLTIAATVPEGWQTQLIADVGIESTETTVERILASRPDVVAFSALTPSIDRAARISRILRRDGITTVIGGLHSTADPESCRPNFDVVVQGDGEPTFPKLLDDWSRGNHQATYRPAAPFDLRGAPLPRWDLLGSASPPRFTLQTMRGCTWACSFCAASRLLGPARAKPIDRVAEELSAIKRFADRPLLELADDNTFSGDRDHEELLDVIAHSKARCFARPSTLGTAG